MPSPSTLIRRARKARNPREAKRLRKLAAAGRRAARADAKKKPAKKKAKPATREEGFSADAPREEMKVFEHTTSGWQPAGWQPAAPGIDGDGIERLRTLAQHSYQPGEVDQFAIGLRAQLVEAKVAARSEAEENGVKLLKTVHEVHAINVVSAFMAEIQGIQKLNGGPLPPTLMLSGYTIARVYDALRDAGYTTEGKGGVNRASINKVR